MGDVTYTITVTQQELDGAAKGAHAMVGLVGELLARLRFEIERDIQNRREAIRVKS
jgi:hypothetical protein